MASHLVCMVFRLDGHDTPEEAVAEVTRWYEHYEHKPVVMAAPTLDELPHPAQVPAASAAFGT